MTTTPAVAPLSADLNKLSALVDAARVCTNLAAMREMVECIGALITQARAAQPKREMPPEMKAAIEEAHKTGATSALLPNGSAVFINYGHDYGDNSHLECTACGGSGHIEDQRARAATVASVEDARERLIVPEWDFAAGAVEAGQGTPLDIFVYNNEPAGDSDEAHFRAQLQAVLDHATQEGK